MKHLNLIHRVAVVMGLAATLPLAAHPTDGVHSPRARALAEDRRTIKEVTPERLERGPSLGSPRGREAFGFMGTSR